MIKNPRTQQPVQPQEKKRFGLMDSNFEYKSAVKTDVRKTWMKFGWKPVHEHDIEGEGK